MPKNEEMLAAIDLGSNSFHMVVAKMVNDQIQIVDQYKEMVRLGGGLDKRQRITTKARKTALECLKRFGQRVSGFPEENVRIVGTNTLRKAKNAAQFIHAAEEAVGYPVEVISGREEARLIYLGVAHFLPSTPGNRLVVDIGGGSTEVIIGHHFQTLQRESLHMGCVSMTQRFFSDGKISRANWNKAVTHAMLELRPLLKVYRDLGWDLAVGASGTLKSVAQVQEAMGWSEHGLITRAGMKKLKNAILKFDAVNALSLNGLSERRQPVFVGGAAIVQALFDAFDLETMQPSRGALREGVLYDLAGRRHHQDVRGRTIDDLVRRFNVDSAQAERVMRLLLQIIELDDDRLGLSQSEIAMLLWAAELHELGRAVAHSHYHRHGAYLIEHADLPGFSRREQHFLAELIRNQRRKVQPVEGMDKRDLGSFFKLLVLLRLALILCRERTDEPARIETVSWVEKGKLRVKFESGWLKTRPLTKVDLEEESRYLKEAGLGLRIAR